MTHVLYTTVESPIGELLLVGDDRALSGLYMQEGRTRAEVGADWERDDQAFDRVGAQLYEYFAGARTEFDVPLGLRGTPFQEQVWSALREIPYGETSSYAELAERIGRPAAVRAVGAANGRNPVAVIVPCHRVIGSDGGLTGFGGGLERKQTLLDLEAGRAANATTVKLIGPDGRQYLSETPGTLG